MAIDGRRLTGTNGNDTLSGGGKNDLLNGRGGSDTLFGRGGDDRLFGGNDTDSLYGGSGDDRLSGSFGNDRLYGGVGNDFISPGGNPGAGDVIFGSKGDDTIDFANAEGSYRLNYSSVTDDITAVVRGGEPGSIDKGASGTDSVLGANGITEGFTFIGGQGDDVIRVSLPGVKFVRLSGGEGDNRLVGGRSFDTLAFESDGDAGIELKVEGRNAAGFFGTATNAFGGTDTFRGMDAIGGSDAVDTLLGTGIPDRFVASAGADVIDAGRGADRVSYNEFEVLEVNVDLAAGTATAAFRGGESYTQSLTSIEQILGSRSGDDRLLGSTADDRLETRDGDNVLRGKGGNDTLIAGRGRDSLFGDVGDDTLDGAQGRDELSGGRGDDALTGGASADVFVFGRGDGDDTVADFTIDLDTIRIDSGANAFDDLTLVGGGGSTTVSFADVSIFLEDVRRSTLAEDDFAFG